ncbi:hypothetical protein CW751_08105 [Brumimicrobium salinarum]|uniref:Uncharacterized protein n=1 Tax=Brumimicrobium salinarum TaxID=2058658 RepID=A0A2I0R2B3_9FLAO|nr:hypothetical protein [Brumimicrobium salinarum]PKR80724.1 hypothetical protein CW751_08105 [Brumimicrobium salinarum]
MCEIEDITYDFIQSIIETSNSIVHSEFLNTGIKYIDLMVELVIDEKPVNKTIAIKVVSKKEIYKNNKILYYLEDAQLDYYVKNEMAVLYILEGYQDFGMLWFYEEVPKDKTIKFNVDNEFTLMSFEHNVVPYIINKKQTLKRLKSNLHEPEWNELKTFLMNRFDVLELVYPLIINNKTLDDLIDFCNVKTEIVINQQMNPSKFDSKGQGPKGIELGLNIFSWVYHTNEIIFITPDKYLLLKKQYQKLHGR